MNLTIDPEFEHSSRLWIRWIAHLKVLAARQGYESLSPFIRKILREFAYGHGSEQRDLLAGTIEDEK